jgi:hypothetical protein
MMRRALFASDPFAAGHAPLGTAVWQVRVLV